MATPPPPPAPALTLLEIIKKTSDFFAAKGVESPRLNAEHIIGHALGLKRMQLYVKFEQKLTEPELEKIRGLVRRRAQREPLQYVIGETEFFNVKLKTDRRALIPRDETEHLVEQLAERLKEHPPATILDLGTGTGAIALALAKHWPESRVTAVDFSADALALATENTDACGLKERVTLLQSDWFSALPADAKFDLIVSNPPYLTEKETAEAAPEVKDYEPRTALVAADEGLADLLKIIAGAKERLSEGGLLAMETGIDQHPRLLVAVTDAGYAAGESMKDLSGRDRFVLARG